MGRPLHLSCKRQKIHQESEGTGFLDSFSAFKDFLVAGQAFLALQVSNKERSNIAYPRGRSPAVGHASGGPEVHWMVRRRGRIQWLRPLSYLAVQSEREEGPVGLAPAWPGTLPP